MANSSDNRQKVARRRFSKFLEQLENRQLLSTFEGTEVNTSAKLSAILGGTQADAQTGQFLQYGDTIILNAGTTYTGSFTTRNLGTNNGAATPYVTIRSSMVDKLAPNVRVTPADAPYMARMQSHGSNESVVKTNDFSHHFKFEGIEFVGPASNANLTALISLGDDNNTTVAQVPTYFVIDRCVLRPNTPTAQIRRGIALNSGNTDITNSWIEEMHEVGADSQALGGWNGLGNFNIINNRLEGASENIMFGGSTNLLPQPFTNVVIKGNHVIKPLHWMDGVPNGSGGTDYYAIKNLFELKQGKDFVIENNIFENSWTGGQDHAIVIKLGDRASSPANVTSNIKFKNNIIRNAPGAVVLQGRDYASGTADPGGLVNNIGFENNLFYNIGYNGGRSPYSGNGWGSDPDAWGGSVPAILIVHGPHDVTFNHNTFINVPMNKLINNTSVAKAMGVSTPEWPTLNFKFMNNIIAADYYGFRGDGSGSDSGGSGDDLFAGGNSSVPASHPNGGEYFGDAGHTFAGNILMGQGLNAQTAGTSSYKFTDRPNNLFPVNWTAVGFVNGGADDNFRLATNRPAGPPYFGGVNPYKNAALDGTDPGANIDQVEAGVKGAATGVFYSNSLDDLFVLTQEGTAARPRFKMDNIPPWPSGAGDVTDLLSNYQSFYFRGLGGNDSVDIRMNTGSNPGLPIPGGLTALGMPTRGIIFEGGTGTDTVTVTGNNTSGNTTSVAHSPDGALLGHGSATVSSVIAGVTASGVINFRGADAFSNSNLTSFTLTTSNANDSLTVGAGAAGKYNVGGTSGGVNFLSADVNSSATLTLDLSANDAGAGNDDVTVSSASAPANISVNAGTGSNSFTANAGTFSLNTNLGIGGTNLDLNLNNAGTNVTLPGSQTVQDIVIGSGGKLSLVAGAAATLRASSVAITGSGSQLNLADNDMIIDYTGGSPLGAGPVYSGVSKLLKDGRNGGAWNGIGIVSSSAAATAGLTTLGVAEATDPGVVTGNMWNGQSVDSTALVLKYTYAGDADLSGTIDGDDYLQIDAGYSANSRGFYNGDFDYSQSIDADDYFAIDSNYGDAQIALSQPAGGAPAVAAVVVETKSMAVSQPATVTLAEPESAGAVLLAGAELPTLQQKKDASDDGSLVDELL